MPSTRQKLNKHKPLHTLFSSTFGRLTVTYTGVHFATTSEEMTHMDANHNEYLAAISGMAEHTMPSALQRTYAVGDYVSGISCGKPWSGRIDWFFDNGDACVDVGGAWLSVPVKDITF